mgnify:FL=1
MLKSPEVSRPKIMIIDDVEQNFRALANTLKNDSYDIIIAQSSTEALQSLKMFCPDLILLNIMLHEIDGFSLAELIKSNPNLSNIPIIFLVPSPTDKIISHTFEAGAVDYIKIPFNDRELLARIKTQIDLNFSKKEISQKILLHR